jgi:hypothetical protein
MPVILLRREVLLQVLVCTQAFHSHCVDQWLMAQAKKDQGEVKNLMPAVPRTCVDWHMSAYGACTSCIARLKMSSTALTMYRYFPRLVNRLQAYLEQEVQVCPSCSRAFCSPSAKQPPTQARMLWLRRRWRTRVQNKKDVNNVPLVIWRDSASRVFCKGSCTRGFEEAVCQGIIQSASIIAVVLSH